MKTTCEHCGNHADCAKTDVVNFEGNPDGNEQSVMLCADCIDKLIICNGCDRATFDPDYVGEFDCAACEVSADAS